MNLQPDVGDAFAIIRVAMKKDPAYAYAWHSNIAMAFMDNMPETFWMPDRSEHHKIANEAATSFMSRCWDVKTSATMLEDKNDE